MKTYQEPQSIRIIGQAWEVRRKLQVMAKQSPHLTLLECLRGPSSGSHIPQRKLHLEKN